MWDPKKLLSSIYFLTLLGELDFASLYFPHYRVQNAFSHFEMKKVRLITQCILCMNVLECCHTTCNMATIVRSIVEPCVSRNELTT